MDNPTRSAFEFVRDEFFKNPLITRPQIKALIGHREDWPNVIKDGSILAEFRNCLADPMSEAADSIITLLRKHPHGLTRGEIARTLKIANSVVWRTTNVLDVLGLIRVVKLGTYHGMPSPSYTAVDIAPVKIPPRVAELLRRQEPTKQEKEPVKATKIMETVAEYHRDIRFALSILESPELASTKRLALLVLGRTVEGNFPSYAKALEALGVAVDEHDAGNIIAFNLLRLRYHGTRRVTDRNLGAEWSVPTASAGAALLRHLRTTSTSLEDREMADLASKIGSSPTTVKRMIALLLIGGFLRADGDQVTAQNKIPIAHRTLIQEQVDPLISPLERLREQAAKETLAADLAERKRAGVLTRIRELESKRQALTRELADVTAKIAQEEENLLSGLPATPALDTIFQIENFIKECPGEWILLHSTKPLIAVPQVFDRKTLLISIDEKDRLLERSGPGRWVDAETKEVWSEVG
jgi:Mn-dependent DtxR family transcriptional regulator